jgi:hypothetical protein
LSSLYLSIIIYRTNNSSAFDVPTFEHLLVSSDICRIDNVVEIAWRVTPHPALWIRLHYSKHQENP